MNCDETRNLLHAYHDGELDAAGSLEVARHVQDCPACKNALQNAASLRKAIANGAPYFKAPADLRGSILAAIREKSHSETSAPPPSPRARHWQWDTPKVALAMAACVLLGFFLALFVGIAPRASSRDLLVGELTAGHVRSLLATHLMDVISTDKHTVKPWFDGKIDFAPPVNDLAENGYPLLGGRLDYIGGRAVAVLVYGKQKHFINLFIWPANSGEAAPQVASKDGYNLVNWTYAGMTFWAVSDASQKDLVDFSTSFENAGASTAR